MSVSKAVRIILGIAMVVALVAAPMGHVNVASANMEFLSMGTGSTGGTYFPLGGAIAGVWTTHIDGLHVSTQATGASVDNSRLLGAGQIELSMAMNGVAISAYRGEGAFAGEPIEFSAVGTIYPEVMQVIARQDSGIETIADMDGKRIAVGPPGSGTAVSAEFILAAYGIDIENDITAHYDTFGDAATKLRDGLVDAAFAVLALPAASIEEVAISRPIRLVDISGPQLDEILAADPSYASLEVPAGTYHGQEETAYTLAQWAYLYVDNNISEDIVYNITRVMYEHVDEISAAHAAGRQINVENALSGLGPIPIHPGAERYYKEQGLLE